MNTQHRKVVHCKAEYWQDKINHWKSSNLTQVEFCHQHGFDVAILFRTHNLKYFKKRVCSK